MIIEDTITLIILGVAWLAIGEILYVCFMKSEKDMSQWVLVKFISLFISGMILAACGGVYAAFTEYTKITLITILSLVILAVYLKSNYDIGKYIVKKNKKSKRKKK